MIEHDVAREYASARADGELASSLGVLLDEHLATCAACAAFAAAVPSFGALARAMPRVRAPRVNFPAAPGRRASTVLRWVPALAAALVVALFVVVIAPGGPFRLPHAGAATSLTTIRTLYVERTIDSFTVDEQGRENLVETDLEKVWFRAPDAMRHETRVIRGGRTTDILEIDRGTTRYLKSGSRQARYTENRPRILLPEAISPVLALIGTRAGLGPQIAGRATVRVDAVIGDTRITAYVDAERFGSLDIEPDVVLSKAKLSGTLLRRTRVRNIEYNPVVDPARFEFPPIDAPTSGVEIRSGRAPDAPRAIPVGFHLVRASGSIGQPTDSFLYARGAFPILVEVGYFPPTPYGRNPLTLVQPRVAGRTIDVYLTFGLPVAVINIPSGKTTVRVGITAPLPPQQLAELAFKMYPDLTE